MVQKAHHKLADRLNIAGVVSGPDKSTKKFKLGKFISSLGLTYPQVQDRDLSLTRLFDVKGTPSVVFPNAQREVVNRGHSLPKSLEPFHWSWTRLLTPPLRHFLRL
ncbi:MAG: hypothetical protein ACI9X4_000034 [Glaciecola sp.]|jgi:hypothetical protein